MDEPESDTSSSETESKGSTESAQDVASRLLTIEDALQKHDSKFAGYKAVIVKSMEIWNRLERCELYYFLYLEKSLSMICRIETILARARRSLADLEESISRMDRRRPTAKRKQQRQSFADLVAMTQKSIKNCVELLVDEKTYVTATCAEMKSIAESVNADSAKIFMLTKEFKRKRHKMIAERNKLLAMRNALEDRDSGET